MTDTRPSPWANRVLAHGTEPAGKLLPNDSNWRRHNLAQQRALAAAIGEVGLVADVIVNLRGSEAWGDKKNVKTLVDGHLRAALALQHGEQAELPVAYVDLEPDEERLVLATLDPTKALGPAAFGPLQFRPIEANGAKGDWQPLATVVRVPTLKEIRCPDAVEKPCSLVGSNLFLLDSLASDSQFKNFISVPAGYVNDSLNVPRPYGTRLYIKLRDDPGTVATVTLPVLPDDR